MGPAAQKLTRHSANMRALYWDGHELSLNSSYPLQSTGPKIEDRESKIVGATASRSTADENQTALVKVHLAGVCSTDLQIFKGYMGFKGVPGHEFVGSVSGGPRDLVGKRVVIIGLRVPESDPNFDRYEVVSLVHIVRLEPIQEVSPAS